MLRIPCVTRLLPLHCCLLAIALVLSSGCDMTRRAGRGFETGFMAKSWHDDAMIDDAIDEAARALGPRVPYEVLIQGLDIPSCAVALPPVRRMKMDFADMYSRCAPGVVILTRVGRCRKCRKVHSLGGGTGFMLTADGVCVTTYHLLEDSFTGFYATTIGGETTAVIDVLAAHEEHDIAILQLDGTGYTPLPISTDAPVGSSVGIISHPDGVYYTCTKGIVSRYQVSPAEDNGEEEGMPVPVMLVTAAFSPGSSGGPVLNTYGEVVGMVMALWTIGGDAHEGHDHADIPPMVFNKCVPSESILRLLEHGESGP